MNVEAKRRTKNKVISEQSGGLKTQMLLKNLDSFLKRAASYLTVMKSWQNVSALVFLLIGPTCHDQSQLISRSRFNHSAVDDVPVVQWSLRSVFFCDLSLTFNAIEETKTGDKTSFISIFIRTHIHHHQQQQPQSVVSNTAVTR